MGVRWPYIVGAVLVLFYFVRVSVLSIWIGPELGQLLVHGGRFMLILALLTIVLGKQGFRFSRSGILLLTATFPSTLVLGDPAQALLKWAGWALVFLVFGPAVKSHLAGQIRRAAWNAFKYGMITSAVASCVWYFAKLPVLGRGAFTGIMMHSMLIGPMAALAVVFCCHSAITYRSKFYSCLALLSLIPCLLSGSRSAVFALVIAILVLLAQTVARLGLRKCFPVLMITMILGGLGVLIVYTEIESDSYYQFVAKLEDKGWQNTREGVWRARMSEFQEYPVTGVGIGMGIVTESELSMQTRVVQGESGEINVEPGSSWLALFSMTGLFGALGFVLLAVSLIKEFRSRHQSPLTDTLNVDQLVVLVFFVVHMVAEGYIFAVGNAFCLLFWLTLGRLQDLAQTSSDRLQPVVVARA